MKPANEVKYPDELLNGVRISSAAKELAQDLHHEARMERIYAIIQIALDAQRYGGMLQIAKDLRVESSLDNHPQLVLNFGDETPPQEVCT